MPNAKSSKSGQRRRQKRAGRGSGTTGLTSLRVGLPDRFRVTMPYSTYQVFAPAAGAVAYYTFRGNSVFDPDFTGVGTTAFTYTQLSGLYNRYRVVSSKLFVDAVNTGTTALTVVVQATIANAPASATNIIGQRHVAEGSISPNGPVAWKHVASAKTHAIFGVPESQVMSEDDFAGLTGGNPNNVWYWHVSVFNPGGVAGAANVRVRIDYEVFWSMPLLIAP